MVDPQPPPLFTRSFGLLVAGHFLQALGFSSMLLLPVYLEWLGADRGGIGLVMGAASAGGLAARPAVGWALDTLGRRRVIVAGTLLVVAAAALLATVGSMGPWVVALRVVFGMGGGALFSAYLTFVADVVPEHRRTEGIALFGVSGLVPLALTPFIGSLGLDAGDLRWVYPVVSLIALSSLIPVALVREPARPPEAERFRLIPVLLSLGRRELLPAWWATTLFGWALSVVLAFAVVTAERQGLANPSLFFLTYAFGAAAVRLLGSKVPDRLGVHNMVAPAVASCATGLVLLAVSTGPPGVLVAGLVAGLGHGYAFPVLSSQVVDRTPLPRRGSTVTAFTALFDLCIVTFTPVMGLVADRWSDAWMMVFTAGGVAVGLLGWVALEGALAPRRAGSSGLPGPSVAATARCRS